VWTKWKTLHVGLKPDQQAELSCGSTTDVKTKKQQTNSRESGSNFTPMLPAAPGVGHRHERMMQSVHQVPGKSQHHQPSDNTNGMVFLLQ